MKRYPSYIPWLLSLLVISLLVVPYMYAQVERTSSIQGTVKDPSGAVVASATVELTSTALFRPATISTDSSGYYRFDNLRPGTYNLTVSKAGFATHKQDGIDLAVGRGPTLDVTMKVGAATEIVEVTGSAPQIDVVQSKVQTNVTESILANAPTGRSFQSVIQFAPGSRAEPLQGGANNGVLGYQIDGATNAENSYMVEGQETASIQFGDARTNVPMEFTQEVVIKSSGFEAEHGGAIGGIVNVIQKRGSNAWHGSVFTSYSGDAFDSAPNRTLRTPGCGPSFLGANGLPMANSRVCDSEYTQPKKDHYRIWEPGFEVGGYLLKDKLWLFASTVPRLYRQQRTVLMDDLVPSTPALDTGLRTFNTNVDTYYSLARVDAMPWQKVHIYGSWQYNYQKAQGSSYPSADSVFMRNAVDPVTGLFIPCVNNGINNCNLGGSSSNPDDFNAGIGYRQPSLILGVGGDVTITPNLIFASRWGRVYNDYQDRGLPVGIRYYYRDTTYNYNTSIAPALATMTGLDGTVLGTVCPSCVHSSGFSSLGANATTLFDKYYRSNWSNDLSYFKRGLGTHNFKFGYLLTKLSNNVDNRYNTADVYIAFKREWSPSFINCDPAIAAYNLAHWGDTSGNCWGNWGSANLRELGTVGKSSGSSHGLYVQDAWTVGHGLTLNLGVRFDKETVPTYAPGLPAIDFGWGSKIAPRLGASWDVMHNGKFKLYGSFGYFYDLMKYDLPRGSFGGDYWHDCGYALDSPFFSLTMVPERDKTTGHYCPGDGSAASGILTGGRFAGNEDFRVKSNDPTQSCDTAGTPGSCVQALKDLKPTKQHEIVFGADWAIRPGLALETRWARKRLDRTIEDAGLISPAGEGYAIVNPGFGLHATTCTGCPANPKAERRYDGLEFRLTRAASAKWFGQLSYTYSKLEGNYSGLTATDISDGGGGRQGGDVSRAFDEPFMSFDAHGKKIDGPLATDRPHALKALGYYRLKWWKMETLLGGFQQWYSGSPLSSYESVWGAPVFVEGRGNWINMTADPATGVWIPGSIVHGKRTPTFSQTDLSFSQEMHVSKQNENLKLALTMNFTNIFNQHSPTFIDSNLLRTSQIRPATSCGGPNYPQLLEGGYNYVDVSNGISSCLSGRVLNPDYGLPYGWQNPRTMRFKVAFHF